MVSTGKVNTARVRSALKPFHEPFLKPVKRSMGSAAIGKIKFANSFQNNTCRNTIYSRIQLESFLHGGLIDE
jgi:hypothetical protein